MKRADGLCPSCAHEPEWRQVEDFIAGMVDRGECRATEREIDFIRAEGAFQLIAPDGPLTECEAWTGK